ncbi:hypothetical protein FHG85_07550 [Tenuifilum thalassicum]|uniref:Phospholipid/glycerol acyltransferase domain-containing protein n=2 Tax=Tenuifilum thalassicum TaxID=2590900 RepID=A0A7D4BBM8_9BACT|nr:hypothetical protein FHG85_07550 [Tenuifilum thalassicum]
MLMEVIKPPKIDLFYFLFKVYANLLLNLHFREIRIEGDFTPDNRSVLLIPNHFSWWDGFFAWKLNTMLLRKEFYLMMLESELKKHRFLKKLGAYAIVPTSKGMLESLRFASEVLTQPNNVLVYYPQGRLHSQHHMGLEFQKGIERIAQQSDNFRLLMCANLIDYYNYKKPSLTIYLQEYDRLTDFSLTQFQLTYNLFLKQSIYKQDKLYKQ